MKTSKYFSIFFLFILFGFSFGIYINYIIAHINVNSDSSKSITESKKTSNYIDWLKEYPVDDKNNNQVVNKKTINRLQNYYNKIKKIISNIDSCSKNYLPQKMKFIEFGHFLNKLIGGNMFLKLDGLIRFDNGYLGYLVSEKGFFEDDGKRTVDFAKHLESQNIKFAYVLCPSKFSKFKNELPTGMIDYSNENADSFLKVLNENKVNVLDLREELNKDYPNHFDAFFKTDHHWKPETGFWAAQKIVRYLNNKLEMNLDENIIIKDNFEFKTYPNLFLGSQGKKVTLSFAEPEDFTVITPKFNTYFYYEVYCRDIKRNGNFKESLLNLEQINNKDFYKEDCYGYYLGYTGPVAKIDNKLSKNETKILIIDDSFSLVTVPFLALTAKQTYMFDIRKNKNHFNGSIYKFIDKHKPNVVLILYSVHSFQSFLENNNNLHYFE